MAEQFGLTADGRRYMRTFLAKFVEFMWQQVAISAAKMSKQTVSEWIRCTLNSALEA